MFSYLRSDRSGAQIHDMLTCQGYCFKSNKNYQGALIADNHHFTYSMRSHMSLLNKLCNFVNIPVPIIVPVIPKRTRKYILDDSVYNTKNTAECFTAEYLDFIRQKSFDETPDTKNAAAITVAVHLRRGDGQKEGRWDFRYTSNEYYLKLIKVILDFYNKKQTNIKVKVKVFSQKQSDTPFDDFTKLGCELYLDTDEVEAWTIMRDADIFIMASSSFSFVPAILNANGIIVHTHSKYYQPHPDWISDDDIDTKIKTLTARLIERN